MTQRISLAQLRKRFVEQNETLTQEWEQLLRNDERKGAQAILRAVEKRRQQNRTEGQRLRKMLMHERGWWAKGYKQVAGVDEAGMSPLAGPIVAAAVILPENARWRGVDDSKKLTKERREALAEHIKAHAIAWATGSVTPEEIDRLNVYHAGLLAMRRAVIQLNPAPVALLVDARTVPDVEWPQEPLIKGDARSLSIAAASILAKTTRDRLMISMETTYPGYGFAKHKGYPVAAHKAALKRLGPTPIHRKSFAAVRELLTPQLNLSFQKDTNQN
jgi:ribonuclease HII